MQPTEKEMANALLLKYSQIGHTPITTRFTGMGIGEADVISVTKAGFINEYEIKRSRSDFQADFRNKSWKHKYMAERAGVQFYTNGSFYYLSANYFWFVMPRGLVKEEEIPEYAGLIYYENKELHVIKKAPRLHSHKANERLYKSIAHNLMNKMIYGGSFMNYVRKEREAKFMSK